LFDYLEMLRIRILFVVLYENVIAPYATFLATVAVDHGAEAMKQPALPLALVA
jgi:hypothetical protein